MKTALIFGAGGFVGRYLTRELKEHGYRVAGSDVVKTESARECDAFECCDLLDMEAVRRTVDLFQPDLIVNLAAISSVGQSWKMPGKTMEVNVCGGLNILEAARASVPQAGILFVGSSEEYAVADGPIREDAKLNAGNPYGISKLALEQFSEIYRSRYGMKVHHVRSFNHTGIGQSEGFVIPSWCRQAARISESGKPGVMKVGNTEVIRDFGCVKDVVRAYRMVLESGDCETVYNIGNGQGVKLADLLAYIISLSKQPITAEQDPALMRPSDNPVIICDHSLITERLGWEPEYTIFDTVKEMFEEYSRQEMQPAAGCLSCAES